MSLDVRSDHLKIVQDILNKHVPGWEVWAFGSRVTGKATETSDLDLAIIGDTPLDFETLAALRDAFSESRIPYKVDVVDWASISETFRKIITNRKIAIDRGIESESSEISYGGDSRSIWQTISLGKLAINFDSQRIPVKGANRKKGSYPYYGASGIVDYIDDYLFDGEYLLVAEDGENLRTKKIPIAFLAKGRFWVNNHAHILQGSDKADTRFLMYALQSADVAGYITGSTMPKLTQTNLDRIPIPTPPLPEQRAIAHILGTMDDKIELNRRMNETLEAMARAIFKSWFVDFDPVRAKMEGRETGLPKEIEDLFPDSFEDSELGEIPRGWGVRSTGEAFELNPSEKLPKGKNSPYLDMSAIPTQSSWPESPIYRPFVSGSKFRNGDTLFARITPCLENGKTAYIQCLGEEQVGWGSTEFIVIRPKAPFPKEFGYLLARNNAFREHAIQCMSGTSGRQRVQLNSIAAFKILRPCDQILMAFEVAIRQWFKLIKVNSELIGVLNQMRDALLPQLLSGQIRVQDASSNS
jgi:type I restriction enzyme S subunit